MALHREAIRNRFRKAAIRQGWWNTDKPVIAAVSGGGDSVALLWMLKEFWSGQVVVAHLEHGIRGETSLRDALFVRELARNWGFGCRIEHRDIPSEKERGESIEDCARRIRYEFLERTRASQSAHWVLLGHNANDIAETMLFHLLRGTGLRGLVGIPETRGFFARPLVDFQGPELRNILAVAQVSWCEDETNNDERYTRNFIRKTLIPLIRERVNPAAERHLSALSREVSLLIDEQNSEIHRSLRQIRYPFPYGRQIWKQRELSPLRESILSLCIRQEARELGLPTLDRERTLHLAQLMRKGGRWRFQWKEGIEVCCGSGLVGWIDSRSACGEAVYDLSNGPGEATWGNWRILWDFPKAPPEKAAETEIRNGFQVLVKLPAPVSLKVQTLSTVNSEKVPHPGVPWWAEKGWPVLFIGSTMSWSPKPSLSSERRAAVGNGGKWISISLIRNEQNGSELLT